MVIRRMSVLTVLVAVLAAAGCARDGGSGSSAGAPAPASSALPAPSTGAVTRPETTELPGTDLPLPSKARPGGPGAQTITGTVSAGVEPDCLLLAGDGTQHLLVFDDPAMRTAAEVGAKVTVTGRAEPGMMSTCQQGVPFIVTSVQPN
jgi:hypothetical protein